MFIINSHEKNQPQFKFLSLKSLTCHEHKIDRWSNKE